MYSTGKTGRLSSRLCSAEAEGRRCQAQSNTPGSEEVWQCEGGGHVMTHDRKKQKNKKEKPHTFVLPLLNKILSPVSSSSRWGGRISPAPSWSLRREIELVQLAAKKWFIPHLRQSITGRFQITDFYSFTPPLWRSHLETNTRKLTRSVCCVLSLCRGTLF